MLTRKPSPRSVLKNLPQEAQDQLGEFLSGTITEADDKGKPRTRGRTLAEGVDFAADTLKIKTNDSSLSDWFPWWKMARRMNSLADTADELEREMKTFDLDPDLAAKIAQRYFLSGAAEDGDAKTFALMSGLIQRHLERKSSEAAHVDKIKIADKTIAAREKSLLITLRRAEAAEKRAAALEEKNRLAIEAANKTKAALKGSGALSDEDRQNLIATMDEILLGKKKVKKEEGAKV
jgi:hypothetical protein